MPALAKTTVAVALSLALVGGGAATLAQPATALDQHATYVTMVAWEHTEPAGEQVLSGQVPCTPDLPARVWAAFSGRPACTYEGYAYAYPAGAPAPWEGEMRWVNDSYHTDRQGGMWHTAEIVYRVAGTGADGESTLVRAMASELLPDQPGPRGEPTNYALPVDEELLGAQADTLAVGIGPSPVRA